MALTSVDSRQPLIGGTHRTFVLAGMAYARSGVVVMWLFWICFVIFLAQPARILPFWPCPTVDTTDGVTSLALAGAIDVGLIALFGLQHSMMARPWFKAWWASSLPEAFERCTFVHMANMALFALIPFWRPIPLEVWSVERGVWHDLLWLGFGIGSVVLFAGAWSFGILRLLGVDDMRRWATGRRPSGPRLQTNALYRWLQHPMYVGVLMGVWVTPSMTIGHLLLASGLTLYVIVAMRYEERDLLAKFGACYARWRSPWFVRPNAAELDRLASDHAPTRALR
jgi:methanethiol S-methyltransferase